ncbi:TPA: serine hydrolase [Streptococcus suis]
MKKVISLVLLVCWCFTPLQSVLAAESIVDIAKAAGYPASEETAPKSSIVINADNGQILWDDNGDLVRDPASTSKVMVVYLTLEAISQGKITLDTEVVATEQDQAIAQIYALSNNNILAGVSYKVRELLTMTLVPSSNVATLMLAHLIFEGDDAGFLTLMNDTAQALGMKNTVFYNATGAISEAYEGLYAPEGVDQSLANESTAKDLAILGYHMIKRHPEVLEFTNATKVIVKEGTPNEESFEAYNHSLPGDPMGIEGVDGLKTGSSPSAGYNSIVTAKRGDTRLITVVLGASEWGDPEGEFVRHYYVNGLLEKSFEDYKQATVLEPGKHTVNGEEIRIEQPLTGLVKEGEEPSLTIENNKVMLANSIDSSKGVDIVEEKPVVDTVLETTNSLISSPLMPYILLGLGIFFGLLVLLFIISRIKKKRRRARAGGRRGSR